MAIAFEANYSKKLGLPSYSSHQYSLTIRTEVTDVSQVQTESAKLYALLQASVDREIQQTGFLPDGNHAGHPSAGNGQAHPSGNGRNDVWACSEKQRDLILKIVEENHLDKNGIEELAQDRFGKGVRALNKLEASGLIDELLERHGKSNGAGGRRYPNRRYAPAGGK